MVRKSVRGWLALGLLGAAVPAAVWAQGAVPGAPATFGQRIRVLLDEEKQGEIVFVEDETAAQPSTSEYWLGIALGELSDIVKQQLGIEQGLVVDDVLPDSPAAKAEFKPLDILVKVDGQPVKEPADLLKAVNAAKDKELSIALLRGGKELTIAVKPAKRPLPEAGAEGGIDPRPVETRPAESGEGINAEIKKLEDALQALRIRVGKDPLGIWFARPGVVGSSPTSPEFPKNLKVQITKEGNQPAKIHVKRDDQVWELTENELKELPEDVRAYVQPMLGRHPLGVRMLLPDAVRAPARSEARLTKPAPPVAAPVPATPAVPAVPGVVRSYPKPRSSVLVDPEVGEVRAYRVESRDGSLEAKMDLILKKLEQMESRSLEQLQTEVKQLRKELDEVRSKR